MRNQGNRWDNRQEDNYSNRNQWDSGYGDREMSGWDNSDYGNDYGRRQGSPYGYEGGMGNQDYNQDYRNRMQGSSYGSNYGSSYGQGASYGSQGYGRDQNPGGSWRQGQYNQYG